MRYGMGASPSTATAGAATPSSVGGPQLVLGPSQGGTIGPGYAPFPNYWPPCYPVADMVLKDLFFWALIVTGAVVVVRAAKKK
jgi:hypothetical protein